MSKQAILALNTADALAGTTISVPCNVPLNVNDYYFNQTTAFYARISGKVVKTRSVSGGVEETVIFLYSLITP